MVIRGWWLKATSMSRRAAMNVVGWILLLLAMLMIGIYIGQGIYYERGFKDAYVAYLNGDIDCLVKVRHPEWLKNGR